MQFQNIKSMDTYRFNSRIVVRLMKAGVICRIKLWINKNDIRHSNSVFKKAYDHMNYKMQHRKKLLGSLKQYTFHRQHISTAGQKTIHGKCMSYFFL
jgi:hypothetical protein